MVAIPFPLSSSPGANPQEASGRLINCYAEPRGEGQGPIWRRVAGLSTFGTTTRTGFRGMHLSGANLFSAWSGQLEFHTSSGGASTNADPLAGTTRVTFATNNNATPQNVAVTENGAFTFTTTTVAAYVDGDLPQPTDVTFGEGYFFFAIGDGRCFASGLNAVTQNANDNITCEGNRDGLKRGIYYDGVLYLFGDQTIELWSSAAGVNATGFPFSRAAQPISRGLLGKWAIAGHENGFGNGLLFVGDDAGVHRVRGYTLQKVSPPDLDRLIAAVTDTTTLEASVYIKDGHPFWQLSSDDWTWVFDLNTEKWHERQSYLQTRSRFDGTHYAFGKWLTGDTDSGDLFEIDADARDEAVTTLTSDPLRVRLESGRVEKFPNRIRVGRADFDFVVGVGDAQGTANEQDPGVEISWSDNAGATWSNPRVRKLGQQGEYGTRVSVINAGLSGPTGRRWRLDVSDAVHVGLIRGEQSADLRTA